ncbi:Gfo/Idh/MocA family protein [Polaribacter septentrionalilitoris]|uniref:Gfo/Idh/MocA family protein n=1 Tax=Polaribacter septentrionalilitoris TaxID=2494657 RepID=UPI00135C4FD6|nr:Gfo/Idh/MocA family oxidoreductase [Polaribacter septentrionalilitoris]
MNTIKWGIIGCGDVAEVKSGPAFQKVANSELVAVMRRNGEKAQDFAKRHNVPFFYDTVDAIINHPEINALYIATPPSTHLEIAKQCLAADKFVYLEKPMTIDADEALELEALVNKNDKIVVAHYRRNLPAFQKVKELLDADTIGKVHFADITILQSTTNNVIAKTDDNWRLQPETSGGGYFHDIAPHQIDLMYHYFGKIEKAEGYATSTQNKKVADIVNGIIEFENGVQFRGIWNFIASEKEVKDECKIYGEKGTITFSFYGEKVFLNTTDKKEVFSFENPAHVQQPLIEQTVNYFLEKATNPCSIKDGVEVMKILDVFTT